MLRLPRADYEVVSIDPLRFLTGWRNKRRLNQALSVLSLSLGFLSVLYCCLSMATFCLALVCVLYVLFLLVVMVSVPVQVTDCKDSSPK